MLAQDLDRGLCLGTGESDHVDQDLGLCDVQRRSDRCWIMPVPA
ncbi:hypothetical protein Rumeso_04371 [Rubellimicrobium mesophilum DSM 19309]|uniref:Uncharacterized protein n=1 Tax=Rubellimicrobium mesophilum DSM 19309 TaxID=442562 RepID=A0A017HHY6_9RHOB|nr:hypothetical protein Rumeso_04371 [Rubellimicrobium mesophilum DSM 19309]